MGEIFKRNLRAIIVLIIGVGAAFAPIYVHAISGTLSNGLGVFSTVPKPISLTSGAGTSGDGFQPILYQDRIFTIHHHQIYTASTTQIVCFEKATGQNCPEYGIGKNFTSQNNSEATSVGTGDIRTALFAKGEVIDHYLITPTAQGVTGINTGVVGFTCWDLDTAKTCGSNAFFQLAALQHYDNNPTNISINGLERVGNVLYTLGVNGRIYCADYTNPLAPVLCSINNSVANSAYGNTVVTFFHIQKSADNQRIFTTIHDNSNSDVLLNCINVSNGLPCTGWTSTPITVADPDTNVYSGPMFSTHAVNGTDTGVCVMLANNASPAQCYSNLGVSVGPPSGFAMDATLRTAVDVLYVAATNKSYLPFYGIVNPADRTAANSLSYCYDWNTQAPCASYGTSGLSSWGASQQGANAINGGLTSDYSYTTDTNGCMWGNGDAGYIWSFDSVTGNVPCLNASTTLTLVANNILCTTNPINFDSLKVSLYNVPDVTQLNLTLRDKNNSIISGYNNINILSSPTVDLSSLTTGGNNSSITALITMHATSENQWNGGNQPRVELALAPTSPLKSTGCPGAPNTGYKKFTQTPWLILATTIVCTSGLIWLARKYNKAS